MLGKEAALWLPTGTMANQVAVRTLTRPGNEVAACRESHAAWHELGGAAASAGVQIHEIGHAGARTLRAVTHLDVGRAQCERAAEVLVELAVRGCEACA